MFSNNTTDKSITFPNYFTTGRGISPVILLKAQDIRLGKTKNCLVDSSNKCNIKLLV